MAKVTVTYPNGVTKVKYETKRLLATPQKKVGKVQHLPGARYYIKPALGKVIIRKSGVTRYSADVADINARLKAAKGTASAPYKCGGRPWAEFVSCLSKEMAAIVGGRPKVE